MDGINIFTTGDQYAAALKRQQEAAHRGLHELQMGIDLEDHWVRFVDLDNGLIEFGRVLSLDEIKQIQSPLINDEDLLFSIRHDRYNLYGQYGYTHRSHVWPIEERLFSMAVAVDFDHSKFDQTARFLLEVAFRSMRAHVVNR